MTPNAIDLTWLSVVKQRASLGVQPDGSIVATADDNEVQAAITAFSRYILDRSGVSSLNSLVTLDEFYDGNGNDKLFLRSTPISSLVSVKIYNVSIPISQAPTAWGAFIAQSGRYIGLRGWLGNFTSFPYPNYSVYGGMAQKPIFINGTANVEVNYVAGYPATQVTNEIDTITNQTIALQTSPWFADKGVLYYPSLVPLVLVPNTPAVGQYSVSNGLYTFNVGDNTKQVAVSYTASLAPADLEYAVRNVVALNYKRKAWQDQASRAVTGGGTSATTRFRDWAWPPEYDKVFEYYRRLAVIS